MPETSDRIPSDPWAPRPAGKPAPRRAPDPDAADLAADRVDFTLHVPRSIVR